MNIIKASILFPIAALFILFIHFVVFAAAEDVDTSFNASVFGQSIGQVSVIKKQPDGKILIGGLFADVNGYSSPGIARLNADLTVDESFNSPDFVSSFGDGGIITSIGFQSDGKIIVGGEFIGYNEVLRANVIRLNIDGSLDSSFVIEPMQVFTMRLKDIEILPNDKIIIGGFYRFNGDGSARFLSQLNADGSFDFNFPASSEVWDIEVQSDGKILAVNDSLTRYNSDGTQDSTFTPVVSDSLIYSQEILGDGTILIGGNFGILNGFAHGTVAKINTNGSIDLNFNLNNPGAGGVVFGSVFDIETRTNGKIVIGGHFSTYNLVQRSNVAQLNADGSLDKSFQNPNLISNSRILDLSILSDGNVLVGRNINALPHEALRLLGVDGLVDMAFSVFARRQGIVRAIAVQNDGKVLLGGRFRIVNGVERHGISRNNPDGTIDTSFIPFTNGLLLHQQQDINEIIVQPDGKILTSGNRLRRFNTDGTEDTGFSNSDSHNDISLQPDGMILGATTRVRRYSSDGVIDNTFQSLVANGEIYKVHIQPDGKILLAGDFTEVGGVIRGRVARLNSDGSLDTSFNPPGGANDTVRDIALQDDGKVLLVGEFTGLGGNTGQIGVGRLNSDGAFDSSFANQTIHGTGRSVFVQKDGKIIVGSQNQFAGVFGKSLVRFNSNGTSDLSLDVNPNGDIYDLEMQSDGKILIGGSFSRVEGISKVRVARLNNDSVAPGPAVFDFDGDGQTDITVFRPSTGFWYQLLGSNYQFSAFPFGLGTDVVAPADYDGDGKTDVGVFRPSTGDWWYLSSETGSAVSVHWGAAGDIPLPSDFDGDGKADFIVYRPSNSTWYRFGSSNGQAFDKQFGIAEDKPLVGDFNGDGKSEYAIFRPSTAGWSYFEESDGSTRTINWGLSTDIPAPGDFDGDGKTDFAVFRPSNGVWYIYNSSDASFTITQFGISEDRPIPGDYDGDGKTDIAVYRPSQGTWYLLRSTQGFGGIQFGVSSDVAIPNAFIP